MKKAKKIRCGQRVIYAVAFFIAAAAIGIGFWVANPIDPGAVHHQFSPPSKTEKTATERPLVKASAQPDPPTTLAAEYLSSPSLRVFVENAKKRPELGGIRYARIAIEECAFAPNSTALNTARLAANRESNDELRRVRLAAIDSLQTRCADFTADELTLDAAKLLLTLRGAESDPFLASHLALGKAITKGDDHAIREALDQTFRQRDLIHLSRSFPLRPNPPFFNGITYPGDALPDLLMAWGLVPCWLGMDCGPNNPSLIRVCAIKGQCGIDMLQLTREVHASRGGSLDFDALIRLSREMAEAVAAARIDAFWPLP